MKTAFPQFAQTGQHGPMQQDAEECYTQLLLSISNKLPKFGNQDDKTINLNNSAIGQLFSGELSSVYVSFFLGVTFNYSLIFVFFL